MGLFLGFGRNLDVPLEFYRNRGNLLSCTKGVKSPFEFLEGTRACTQGSAEENCLISPRIEGEISLSFSSCGGKFGFLLTCDGELREPLVLPQ